MENQDDLDDYYKNKKGCDVKGAIIFMALAIVISIISSIIDLCLV